MKIFLSYSHEDIQYQNELILELGFLKSLGDIEIWYDDHLDIGENWKNKIDEKIFNSDGAIFLLSNPFLGSVYCRYEFETLLKIPRERIYLYPILVQPCGWPAFEDLTKLNIGPKDENRRAIPLVKLSEEKRKVFYTEFGLQIYKDYQNQISDIKDMPPIYDAEERNKMAVVLATQYKGKSTVSLKRLVVAYMSLYKKGFESQALDLLNSFKKELIKKDFDIERLEDSVHVDILKLLGEGFPQNPVHLKGIGELTVDTLDTLFVPGYAAHLLGIRLTEKDHNIALEHLREVSNKHPNLNSCALIAYVIGLCHRKLGNLDEAAGMHQYALLRMQDWEGEYCECGPKCSKGGLLVEIYRGLGAIYRKLENWEETEKHFSLGDKALKKVKSKIIQSDYKYSFGYFVFERACKAFATREIGEEEYRSRLEKAKKLFYESHILNPRWSAPFSRFQIVKQLLGDFDKPGYIAARELAHNERGVEFKLTAVMCQFAVLVYELFVEKKSNVEGKAQQLYHELMELFKNTFVPRGPRVCHIFDMFVILESRELLKNGDLFKVYDLLDMSVKKENDFKNFEEQKEFIKKFTS